VARGDYHEHSDIDILVVLPVPVDNAIEEQIFDMAYDIELEYGLVIGTSSIQKISGTRTARLSCRFSGTFSARVSPYE